MNTNYNEFVRIRVVTMQLFHIKMMAKTEGCPDLFPIIKCLIEHDNQILKDYHLLKFDKKFKTTNSIEDLEFEFLRNITYYRAEQEAAIHIFNSLKSLPLDDDLVNSIDVFFVFLSENHRSIYQYMAGKGYLEELDEYFNPICSSNDSEHIESKEDKPIFIIDENHPQIIFYKEGNETIAELVGDIIIDENCKIDINNDRLDDDLSYNNKLVFSGKVKINGDFNAGDYYVEIEEDFKCTGDISAFMLNSDGSLHVDGNVEIMSIFSVDKNLFVSGDVRADKIYVGSDFVVNGEVDTTESIDTSTGKLVIGSIYISNPEI